MFTSRISVTLDVQITVETDPAPHKVPAEEMEAIILENTADILAQFNMEDLKAAITGHEVLSFKDEDAPLPKVCHKCQANLTQPRSVSRLYVAKSEGLEDASCLGHYELNGDFEPDSTPSVPLEHHDLLDNSDECQSCGAVVG